MQESCLTIMLLPTSNNINTNLNSTQFIMTCRIHVIKSKTRPSVLDLITCILQVYIFLENDMVFFIILKRVDQL